MAHHVLVGKSHHGHPVHALQRLHGIIQPRARAARQIDLAEIARDHHLRPFAKPCQTHLHLNAGGVLGLVQDDEGMSQGPSPHESQRRHLDIRAGEPFDHLIAGQHVVKRIIERAQIRIDLLADVARQEPQSFPRLHRRARQDDSVDLAGLEGRHRCGDGEIGLAGARRAQAEHQFVIVHGIDIGGLGRCPRRDAPPAGLDRPSITLHLCPLGSRRQLARGGQADDGIDFALVRRRAPFDPLIQRHQGVPRGGGGRLRAGDRHLVAPRVDGRPEVVLDAHKIAVVFPEQ